MNRTGEMVRGLALLLATLVVLASPVRAEGDEDPVENGRKRWEQLTKEEQEKILKAHEEWKGLSEDERRKRQEAWNKHLEDLSPQERKELLEKLDEIKKRNDLGALREKHERFREIERKYKAELDTIGERYAVLKPEEREAIFRFTMGRGAELMKARLLSKLSEEERARLKTLRGRDRHREFSRLMHDVNDEDKAVVLKEAVAEARVIVELPPEKRKERLASLERRHHGRRMERALEELGLGDDPDLPELLSRVKRRDMRRVLGDLRRIAAIESPQKRQEALNRYKAKLRR